MSNTAAGTMTVWPVFDVDFNMVDNYGVWTVLDERTVVAWNLRVGSRVIVEDLDDSEELRFFGTVARLKPCPPHAPGKWVVSVDYDEPAPRPK